VYGDLFSGLINLKKVGNHRAFYGSRYESLNNFNYTEADLQKLQIVHLSSYLEGNKGKKRYDNAVYFISEMSKNAENEKNELQKKSINQIYKRIIELLNSTLVSSEESIRYNKESKQFYNISQIKEKGSEKYKELSILLNYIQSEEPIPTNILEMFEKSLNYRKFNFKTNKKAFIEYVQNKAEYAEELAVQALNKNKNWISIRSGNFVDSFGKQLIEDVITFSKKDNSFTDNNGNLLNLSLNIIGEENNKVINVSSVEELIKELEGLSGKYTVQLSDELYDALKEISVLNTQVKSGINQSLFNKNMERNKITLGQIGFNSSPLWELFTLKNPNPYFKKSGSSKDLSLLTNYYLSKSINMTVLSKNELYYTKDGFVTAAEWMAKNNKVLKFNPDILKMSINMLTLNRGYKLASLS
jgi:hypothetical protein